MKLKRAATSDEETTRRRHGGSDGDGDLDGSRDGAVLEGHGEVCGGGV